MSGQPQMLEGLHPREAMRSGNSMATDLQLAACYAHDFASDPRESRMTRRKFVGLLNPLEARVLAPRCSPLPETTRGARRRVVAAAVQRTCTNCRS